MSNIENLKLFWCVWGRKLLIREALASAAITKIVNQERNPGFSHKVIIPIYDLSEPIDKKFFEVYEKTYGIEVNFITYTYSSYWQEHYLDFYRLNEMEKSVGPTLYMDADALCIKPIDIKHPSFGHDADVVFHHTTIEPVTYPTKQIVDYFDSDGIWLNKKDYLRDPILNTGQVINFGTFFCHDGRRIGKLKKEIMSKIDTINKVNNHERPKLTYNEFLLTKIFNKNIIPDYKIVLDKNGFVKPTYCKNFDSGFIEIEGTKDDVRGVRTLCDYTTVLHSLHHFNNNWAIRFFYQDKKISIWYNSRKDLVFSNYLS